MTLIDQLKRDKLVVIARGIPTEVLLRAAEVCAEAGVAFLESTFDHRLDDPVGDNTAKIAALVQEFVGRLRIGAGTVLTAEEARAARDAGAEYIISPDTDPEVIAETKRLGLASIPGAYTPTEIKRAWSLGADVVKLFPADDAGLHYVKNLKGPLPHIPLMATGGVNPQTIPELAKAGFCAFGTGITILRPDLVASKDYEGIRGLAAEHVESLRFKSPDGL